jgi:hypothetical protein
MAWYLRDGDPGKTRTSDTQFRKLLLYPPELRGHFWDQRISRFERDNQLTLTHRAASGSIRRSTPRESDENQPSTLSTGYLIRLRQTRAVENHRAGFSFRKPVPRRTRLDRVFFHRLSAERIVPAKLFVAGCGIWKEDSGSFVDQTRIPEQGGRFRGHSGSCTAGK